MPLSSASAVSKKSVLLFVFVIPGLTRNPEVKKLDSRWSLSRTLMRGGNDKICKFIFRNGTSLAVCLFLKSHPFLLRRKGRHPTAPSTFLRTGFDRDTGCGIFIGDFLLGPVRWYFPYTISTSSQKSNPE
jgi:hypothetical protein